MSRWINKDLFDNFRKKKMEEKEQKKNNIRRSDLVWENPKKGTSENAKVYEGRFLPDPKGKFYLRYYYHMWQSGDKWNFILCNKTFGMTEYCAVCSANIQLYKGGEEDKKTAYNIKRKERFVGNFFIAKDPRDEDREEENKVNGMVKLYEFPSKVEQKLKNEIVDSEQGYGTQIFDPGEDGRNFILKILSTKKDARGKEWPDYSTSTFSRTQSALGNEEEIEKIMKQTVDLDGYIKSMEIPKSKIVEIMKNEFIWDIVEDDAEKYGFLSEESNSKNESKSDEEDIPNFDDDVPWETDKEEPEKQEEPEEEQTDVDDDNDDDLLAELDKL